MKSPVSLFHFRARPWLFAGVLASLMAWLPACRAFDLQGHRGARGLAPENTLAAFERALEIGVTTLELDIAITADGVPVISHEPALFEAVTRDEKGQWLTVRGPLIKSLTLAQLQAYDVGRSHPQSDYGKQFPGQAPSDGQRIPTLASLFKRVKDVGAVGVQFNIETKVYPNRPDHTVTPEAFVDALLVTIRSSGMAARVIVQSFDWRTLALVHQREPGLRTACLTTQGRNFNTLADGSWTAGRRLADYPDVADLVKAAGCTIWSPAFADLDLDAIRRAQALGLQVIPWTVNNPVDMDRLIGWGVDGLITDYPDRGRDAMRQRALALPTALKH